MHNEGAISLKAARAWTKVCALTPAMLPYLAERMRPLDAAECAAMGHSPREALEAGLAYPQLACAIMGPDGPLCGFGVTPHSYIDRVGRPWMLCTTALARHAKTLLPLAFSAVAAMEVDWPRLENYVGADNAMAIKLIGKLGFAVDAELMEIGGLRFRRFHKGF